MGEWGEGIFQNDVGADCKALATKLLGDGLSAAEVEARVRTLMPEYYEGQEDPQVENQAVLSLALTLHSYGFLEPELLRQAVERIKSELTQKISKSRTKHLEKALEKLNAEQRTSKRPKRQIPYIAPFEPGEFLAVPVTAAQEAFGKEALIYVTGRGFASVCGDRSNTVRILGPLTESFDPSIPPDVPYLSGQEFENPARYFTLLLTSRPSEVRTLGRFFPPPDHRPENVKELLQELEQKGLLKLPAYEDGLLTNGAAVDWSQFLDAIRKVIG